MRIWLAVSLLLIAPVPGQAAGTGRLEQAAGLRTATFDTISGTVTVHLPAEMAAGDTISGTVIAEPSGESEKKRARNLGTLSGYVVEVADGGGAVADGRLHVELPEVSTAGEVVMLVLREVRKGRPGPTIGRVELPLQSPTAIPDGFRLPTLGQVGRSMVIAGPFDGDLATSGLTLGDVEALPLAESPRMAVFRSPQEIIGVSPIELREQGETVARGRLRNVAVSLSAPKVELARGESTTLTTTVSGLEQLEQEIPLELEVWPASVVAMEGGNHHDLVIRPADVGQTGQYQMRLEVTGRLAGRWSGRATVEVEESLPPDRFFLVLEGKPVGYLRSVYGGTISAAVPTHRLGPDLVQKKHLAATGAESITFEVGLDLGRPLYDWIRASFETGPAPRSGEILGVDRTGAEREVHHFREAIIDSVTFPRLDPQDDSPAYMTITVAAQTMRREPGSGERVRAADLATAKKWLCSNFRFEIGDLPVSRVSKVDSFTWKQGVTPDEVGAMREPAKHPAKHEVPDLKLRVSTADLASWEGWHRVFVGAQRATGQGLDGRLVFLGPDLREELATIELYDATMASLELRSADYPESRERRFTIELVNSTVSFLP